MLLYRLLISIAAPALVGMFVWRIVRGVETWADFIERLGIWNAPDAKTKAIWLHGASIGEITSAKSVIEQLINAQPERPIYITCNTITGRDMVRGWQLNGVFAHLAPLDLRFVLTQLIRKHTLSALIVLESDIWPNRHIVMKRHSAPIAMIGARISEKSAAVWAKFPKLAQRLFSAITMLSPQNAESAARFETLGVPQRAILPVLNLKGTVQVQHAENPNITARSSTWLAASTHEGEEAILIDAHALARKQWPGLRMILAPRHPHRAKAIAALIKASGQTYAQRSAGADVSTQCDIFLADTLGEMDQWYAASGIVFVAGSLVAKGGHTPFEPIAHGCAILHGPHTANFADSYSALNAAFAARQCATAQEISAALISLASPEKQARLASAAQTALNKGTSADTLAQALSKLT